RQVVRAICQLSARPWVAQCFAPFGAGTATALHLLLASQRLRETTTDTGIHATCRRLAIDLAMLGRQYGKPRPYLRRVVAEQADAALGFQNAQADLPEVFDALLAQFHEELVRENVVPLQAVELIEAVTNDGHRLALQPTSEALAMAHAEHREAIQRQQGDEDRADRQQRY